MGPSREQRPTNSHVQCIDNAFSFSYVLHMFFSLLVSWRPFCAAQQLFSWDHHNKYRVRTPSVCYLCLWSKQNAEKNSFKTLTTPNPPKSFSWFCLILMDSVIHSIAQWIEHVAMCTKLNRLLLLDSELCIAKPGMLCICYCTNSIKLHRLLLLDSGPCIAKPWILCICYCTNSIKVQQLGVPFYCMLMDFGGFGMVSRRNA